MERRLVGVERVEDAREMIRWEDEGDEEGGGGEGGEEEMAQVGNEGSVDDQDNHFHRLAKVMTPT